MVAYIGIGSNKGNRFKNIKEAINMLKAQKGIKIKKISSIYETEPMYYKKQRKFLNCVVKIVTSILPENLLSILQSIEKRLKRKKTIKYGPRTIDMDMLLYGNIVKNTHTLTIPHPLLHKRAFVLVPLVEICKNLKHPTLKHKFNHFLSETVDQNLGIKRWKK